MSSMRIRKQTDAGTKTASGLAVSKDVQSDASVAGETLVVHGLRAGYGATEILHGISFEARQGELTCIMGANGCGKTTLLRNLIGLSAPLAGSIEVAGRDVLQMSERERSRVFAYVPQAHSAPFPFSVADVVLMSRTPYLRRFTHVSDEDRMACYRAMEYLSIENLAHESYTSLSGGQQQLVLIARAVAQEPEFLVMDEPTSSLDFGNQQLVLTHTRRLVENGMGVIMVTHDPTQALSNAQHVMLIHDGTVLADGTPDSVVNDELLSTIYGIPVELFSVVTRSGRSVSVCVGTD